MSKLLFSLLDSTRKVYSCPSGSFLSPAIPSALECAVLTDKQRPFQRYRCVKAIFFAAELKNEFFKCSLKEGGAKGGTHARAEPGMRM
jgi:hypothetical protein